MARQGQHQSGVGRTLAAAAVLLAAAAAAPVAVQAQGGSVLAPVPKACETPGVSVIADSPLPNIAIALKERKKINILAIGATSASLRGPVSGGYYAVVERFLESTFKGLDVEVVQRGVSGELASDAAERIKTEVALNEADLVLWQLGTADALAQVPVADFFVTVSEAIAWLKGHKVDVILVGLRYTRSMAKDLHYQAMRTAIQEVAKDQNVLRIGRYEAEEMLERIRREQGGVPISQAEVSEASYVCMAEYLARAIAAGLFVRERPALKPAEKSP
jgi:lysophospholipase L1-like esterase